jgi:RNA polymerase sigma factor (sigma-70 family)
MDRPGSFAVLVLRLQARDPDAAAEVVQRFTGRLASLARRHLHPAVRAHLDPEDVVQSALCSFFHRQARSPFRLDDWDGLWQLLARITTRQCARMARRDRREHSNTAALEACIDRQPSPEETAGLKDTLDYLLRGLSDRDQAMLLLRLHGWSSHEISARFACTPRKVQRVVQRVRGRLRRLPGYRV